MQISNNLHYGVCKFHINSKAVFALGRPGARGAPLPARAILSMGGLSHGVIRVNTEDKNSALTVQDVGHIMPGGEPHTWFHLAKQKYTSCHVYTATTCAFQL